jgi:hypothetical protein
MPPEEFRRQASGTCPICMKPFVEGRTHPNSPVVDHDHMTGKVRGVICRICNVGLGYFRDNPRVMESAGYYLMYGREARNISVHTRL